MKNSKATLEKRNKLKREWKKKIENELCELCSGTGKVIREEVIRDDEGVDTRDREDVCECQLDSKGFLDSNKYD